MLKILIKKSALTEYMKKSGIVRKERIGKSADDLRFEQFKKKVLEHLDSLEEGEKELEKSLATIEAGDIKKAGYPVGTIREWKGKKYIKIAQGKWRPKYDGDTRGAKMAVALLKRKASACTDSRELLQLILENRERFSDAQGRPLPFVKELSDYVSALNDKLESGKAEPKTDYKALQEEFKEEIASGKRDNTKELKEDIDEWKNLIASGGYKGEHLDHLKEIVKIGEAELKRRNDEVGEKQTKKTSAKKGALNNAEKVVFVKELKGKPYNAWETDPSVFAIYGNNGRSAGLAMTQDIADIINSHELGIPDWEGTVAKEIHKKYPKIDRRYAELALYPIHMGYRNGKKEKVMIVEPQPAEKVKEKEKLLGRRELDEAMSHIFEHFSDKELQNAFKKNDREKISDILFYGVRHTFDVDLLRTISETTSIRMMRDCEEELKARLGKNEPPINANKQNSSQETTIESIREKYQSSKSVDGDDDSITLPDGTELEGKWKLVEADAPSASHDERTFRKTEGFPTNADGSTINDRDYEHDSAAKEAVIDMAGDFDSRALGIDSPVVVSEDGVVISGNNRTMSSKIAARKGTDKKYVDALSKKARKFGFSSDDVAKFKNPRVVFETKVNGEYSTSQFAKFNESGKKAQSPVEVAVKVSKTANAATVEVVAEKINQYDTLGELYADQKSMREVFSTLIESGVIKKTDLPAYYTDEGGITNNGKEFLETVLIGSVISESNIRSLSAPGGKEIRQKLVRAIVPLVENKGMKGYSIAKELNDAVNIALDIKKNKKFKDAEDYSRQGVLIGEDPDPIAIEFAKKLEGTQKEFAEFMRGLNVGLKPAANGEADIFAGGIESRDDILSRYISIKKSIRELLDSF